MFVSTEQNKGKKIGFHGERLQIETITLDNGYLLFLLCHPSVPHRFKVLSKAQCILKFWQHPDHDNCQQIQFESPKVTNL